MKKRNGFTLIELLAVILILGIIALIAMPTINNIISESRSGAFKTTVQNLILSAEQQCQAEQMKDQTITKLYVFDENGVSPSLNNVKGSLPTSGSIALNDNCEVVASLTNGEITVSKNLITDDYKVVEENTANSNLVAPLNSETSKMFFSLQTHAVDQETLDAITNEQYKEFMTKVTSGGIVFYIDADEDVIGLFETLVIPNNTPEQAVTYMESLIPIAYQEYAKKDATYANINIFYYITAENIYLAGGFKDVTKMNMDSDAELEEFIKTINDLYAGFKSNPPEGYTLFEIEY